MKELVVILLLSAKVILVKSSQCTEQIQMLDQKCSSVTEGSIRSPIDIRRDGEINFFKNYGNEDEICFIRGFKKIINVLYLIFFLFLPLTMTHFREESSTRQLLHSCHQVF
jgi:hypothetical protein